MPEMLIIGGVTFIATLAILFPFRHRLLPCLLALPLIWGSSYALYSVFGGWLEWHNYETARIKEKEARALLASMGSMDKVIERLKARVNETPKDAKAWFLLGRVYSTEGHAADAKAAFIMARRLDPNNESYILHYAQSVWETNGSAFDADTKSLLEDVLQKNERQPDALAMLALNAYNQTAYGTAADYWERLLLLVPKGSEDADKLSQLVAKARAED